MQKKIKLKHSEDYFIGTLLKKIKIKEIMAKPAISIRLDEPFSIVPKKMKEYKIRHLPVVDKSSKVVGIITQRDLFRIHPPRRLEDGSLYYDDESLNSIILANVMTEEPFCMKPEDCIGDALLKMAKKKYGCIPIVDQGKKLCGVITQIDLLKIAAQIYQEGNKQIK